MLPLLTSIAHTMNDVGAGIGLYLQYRIAECYYSSVYQIQGRFGSTVAARVEPILPCI